MFLRFLYYLRERGLKVSTTEWLTLVQALILGFARANLTVFYGVARGCLVKSENDYDRFDQAFAAFFRGVDEELDLTDALLGCETVRRAPSTRLQQKSMTSWRVVDGISRKSLELGVDESGT